MKEIDKKYEDYHSTSDVILFVDTVKLTDENVKIVLPNFNSDLKIPAKKEAVFIKD